jgi:L-methionine (R)-S-oxide reductase
VGFFIAPCSKIVSSFSTTTNRLFNILFPMAEELIVSNSIDKATKYRLLFSQLEHLIEPEADLISNLANTTAALKQTFGFFWVGFYLVKGEDLVLGPFQGDLACTRIRKGKGVCGTAWALGQTQMVPDVDLFPGHIACSSLSRSEIVVPIRSPKAEVLGVLDVDSDRLDDFDEQDKHGLERIVQLLAKICFK